MKKLNIHERVLDSIFEQADKASVIVITIFFATSNATSQIFELCGIRDVNGYSDPVKYDTDILALFAGIRRELIRSLFGLPAAERAMFLELVMKRLELLHTIIRQVADLVWNGGVQGTWVFCHAQFRCSEGEVPAMYFDHLLRKSSRYAQTWDFALTNLRQQLMVAATCDEVQTIKESESKKVVVNTKLELNISVAQYACFMWVFNKNGALGIKDHTQLCRISILICSTIAQQDISFKSFYNNYFSPEPATIEYCITEFRQGIANLQALETKKRA